MNRKSILTLILLFFCHLCYGDYLLHAGHLIDVKRGEILEQMTVTITGNRITSIKAGFQPADAGQQVIDLTDYTVMPGLIDMHTHLTTEVSPGLFTEKFLMESADYAYRAQVYAERTLLAGFTTVRDLGDQDRNLGAAMRRAVEKHYIIGPRIYTAGKGLATTGGLADPTNGLRHEYMGAPGIIEGVVNGPLEARKAVRQRYKDGADLIKINVTGGAINPSKTSVDAQWRQDELNAVVETARDYRMTVAAHAHSNEGIRRAVIAGVTSIEHGTLMDEKSANLMKKHGTVYVPTMTAIKWMAENADKPGTTAASIRAEMKDMGERIDQAFALAYKKGVRIVFGSDAGVFPHGMNGKEFEYMVKAGMPPLAAIQSATVAAADLLQAGDKLGSLETGKLADIVAVRGNPLTDISLLQHIDFVMQDGVIHKQSGNKLCGTIPK